MTGSDALDALGVPARSPSLAYLRELFQAFNEKIPFESASKIVRHREVEDPSEKPRRPEVFWRDHLERGTGGTCFARVAAFDGLLRDLGFSTRRTMGEIRFPRSHAGLLVPLEGRDWIVDVGYPLPGIYPLESAGYDTPSGRLGVSVDEGAATLRFESGPEQGRSIRFELAPIPEAEFEEAWRRTFVASSIFLSGVILRRLAGERILRFHQGEAQILDEVSRARIPLRGERGRKLSETFEIDRGLLERALALTGDPEPSIGGARVEVFREGEDAMEILSTLAAPEGYRRFVEGLGKVEVSKAGALAFEVRIVPEGGEPALETVRYDPEQRILTVDRDAGLRRTGFQVETTDLGTRLVRFAQLPDDREEFLRSDFGRGRIAAVLAMDLVALSRL